MADIVRAGLVLVPRIDNLTSTVRAQLSGASGTFERAGSDMGKSVGAGFGRGTAGAGAMAGAFAAVTSKAMDMIGTHVSSAVSRFDTLKQYPKTMQLLGYSSQDAENSIKVMSDRLLSLPTRLDDMVSTVQGIVAVTHDLDQATNTGLALNDMLVASGANQQLVTAALEQFRQMLAKGKPEMEDWKSLTSAMPGQMDQLAKSMLGPTANANDLYAALGGGHSKATLSMDDLMNAMIRLDTQGGPGMTSFKEQAETAAGGVETAMANLSNAVTIGLANTMDAIGRENISGVINDLKGGVRGAFEGINGVVAQVAPGLKQVYEAVRPMAPYIAQVGAAFLAWKGAGAAISAVAGGVSGLASSVSGSFGAITGNAGKLREAFALVRGGAGTLSESLGAVGFSATGLLGGIAGLAGVVLSVAVPAFLAWQKGQEDARLATDGLKQVVDDTGGLANFAGTLDSVGQKAPFAAQSVDQLTGSIARSVERQQQTTSAAQAQIAQLNTAQSYINQYAGKTDLSTEAQGKLKWAIQLVNDQLGTNITMQDAANGKYVDANGKVQDLKQSISDLIEKKREEARVNAIQSNLTEAYKQRQDAADSLAKAQKDYNDQVDKMTKSGMSRSDAVDWLNENTGYDDELNRARELFDSTSESARKYELQLGAVTKAAAEGAGELDKWATSSDLIGSAFEANGQSLADFTADLSSMHVDTAQFEKVLNPNTADGQAKLAQLARTYDGTTSSIAGLLAQWGIGFDEAAAHTAANVEKMNGQLDQLKQGANGALDGIDMQNFSQKLVEAGVQTQTLKNVGSQNLAQLASATGGNIDLMVAVLSRWNAVPITDKEGKVTADTFQLHTAQNELYVWNGTTLVDKDGHVAVNGTELRDAQNQVWVWNGTTLVRKDTSAEAHGNAVDGSAKRGVDATSESIRQVPGSKTANVHANVTGQGDVDRMKRSVDGLQSKSIWITTFLQTVGNTTGAQQGSGGSTRAAGGIRTHADGGVRKHAGGSIVNNPGRGIPLDIVGEAGAEAIVPLTNRKYSQPFADILAERMAKQLRGDVTNVYIDGASVNDDPQIRDNALQLLMDLKRRAYI